MSFKPGDAFRFAGRCKPCRKNHAVSMTLPGVATPTQAFSFTSDAERNAFFAMAGAIQMGVTTRLCGCGERIRLRIVKNREAAPCAR